MERRVFVELAAAALGVTALPACAAFVAAPVTPVDGEIRLLLRNHPQLDQPGGYLKIRPMPGEDILYVLAAGGGRYAVLSPICTHLSCMVQVEGAQLRCPCHGSTFDFEGNVLVGPAMAPLGRYPATLTAAGELVIRYAEAS